MRLTPLPVNQTVNEKFERKPESKKTENEGDGKNAKKEEEKGEKRKVEYTYQEFKRDCKRLRPEFGNEEDEEFDHNPSQHAGLRQVPHKQIVFFSVFSKENARKNHEIMFSRKYLRKPKFTSAKRMATSAQGQGIKKYFTSQMSSNQSVGGESDQVSFIRGPVADATSVHL